MIPAIASNRVPAMSVDSIERVRNLEAIALTLPQQPIVTHHVLHAGMYARTIRIPAGVLLTGALIKNATMLVVSGQVLVTIGDETLELDGYNVLPASAGRKQAYLALIDTDLTMLFPTSATTVEEAEQQFTDESDRLFSRTGENVVVITGE